MNELIKIIQNDNDEQLVNAKELHKFLEIKTPYKKWFDRIVKYGFKENTDFIITSQKLLIANGGFQSTIIHLITPSMAKEICYRIKNNPKVKEVLNRLGIELKQIHTNTRFEISFGDMLIEALKEIKLEVITQYEVGKYKIDFYIPQHNVAIEYDENQHLIRGNQIKDNIRQTYIENKIGAKFIRCDYRDSDIKNVMKVVKEVISYGIN